MYEGAKDPTLSEGETYWISLYKWLKSQGSILDDETANIKTDCPSSVVHKSNTSICFWGMTDKNGNPCNYSISEITGPISISKDTGIEEYEKVTLTVNAITNASDSASFRISAYYNGEFVDGKVIKFAILQQNNWTLTTSGTFVAPVSANYNVILTGGAGEKGGDSYDTNDGYGYTNGKKGRAGGTTTFGSYSAAGGAGGAGGVMGGSGTKGSPGQVISVVIQLMKDSRTSYTIGAGGSLFGIGDGNIKISISSLL